MRLELTTNADKIAAELRRLNGHLVDALNRNMRTATAAIERTLKRNVTGAILKRRTGRLVNSIQTRITQGKDTVTGEVGVLRIPYARILEEGGIIWGKPWLYIPTNAFRKETSMHRRLPLPKGGAMPAVIRKRFVIIPPFEYMKKTIEQMSDALPAMLQRGVFDASE